MLLTEEQKLIQQAAADFAQNTFDIGNFVKFQFDFLSQNITVSLNSGKNDFFLGCIGFVNLVCNSANFMINFLIVQNAILFQCHNISFFKYKEIKEFYLIIIKI